MPLPFSAEDISTIRGFWKNSYGRFGNRWKMGDSAFTRVRGTCSAHRSAWALLILIGLPLAAESAEVLNSSVIQHQGRYLMHSETVVGAPISEVRALLTDYENLPRANRNIRRVEVLRRAMDGGVRMGVTSDFCILRLCLKFNWVQDIHTLPDGDIVMAIVPNRGDFQQGSGCWRLLADPRGTRLIFDVDLTPNFWIPPVFGSWLMKRKLAEEAFETAQGLERMATSN